MKKSILLAIVMCMALLSMNIVVYADSSPQLETSYDINSVSQLNSEINGHANDGAISDSEAKEITEETNPLVMQDYEEQVDLKATDLIADATPETVYIASEDKTIFTYNIEVDDLTSVILTITDQPETNIFDDIVGSIKDFFIAPAYAASNGDVLWKDYGYRYYTASYTRIVGPGAITMISENHYYLDSSGITEIKLVSWVANYASVTGDLMEVGSVMEDKYATTPGSSDAHMLARFTIKSQFTLEGVPFTTIVTYYERLKIGYLAKDSVNKKIKVVYTWEATTYTP